MNESAIRLELDKILSQAASYASLEGGRAILARLEPTSELAEAKRRLDLTEEAQTLLFSCGAGRVEPFPPVEDRLERAEKGSALSPAELLAVARLLRAARLLFASVRGYADTPLPNLRALTEHLVFDQSLEAEIGRKIVNENELSDHASDRLYSLRMQIRLLGERIRARLQSFLSGEERKFLQEGIVTVRGDRFVIPVKAEYKRSIRGFVHDRSQSGATVFIGKDFIGDGSRELGEDLMKMFLYTLAQSDTPPACLLFMNGGVKLPAGEEPQVIESLKSLLDKGCEILVCGTCLNYFGLTEQLKVGTVSNMYDIAGRLLTAPWVVTV